MKLPPAVIVHGLAEARAALAPGLPVTLLSAPGAAVYAGVRWWRALVQAASGASPLPTDILDCGAAPGRALEALRSGQRLLVVSARADVVADLRQRAESLGATVFERAPPALDLAVPGAGRQLAAWLTSTC